MDKLRRYLHYFLYELKYNEGLGDSGLSDFYQVGETEFRDPILACKYRKKYNNFVH